MDTKKVLADYDAQVRRSRRADLAGSSAEDLGKLLNGHDLIIDLRTRGRITVRAALPEAGAQTASNTQS